MLVKLLVTEVLQQAQPVLSPAQNVQMVTNGTSPPKRLPDHLFTTSGSGSREMRRGRQHPFFFVRALVLEQRHPYGGNRSSCDYVNRLQKFVLVFNGMLDRLTVKELEIPLRRHPSGFCSGSEGWCQPTYVGCWLGRECSPARPYLLWQREKNLGTARPDECSAPAARTFR